MPKFNRSVVVGIALGLACLPTISGAVEYPIGQPQQRHGMEIGAVYLQPIDMEPDGMMRKAAESDVHMESVPSWV